MTVYLKHRLEKSGLGPLVGVCVCQTEQQWIFEDIASELLALFPSAEVWSSGEEGRGACELAVVPYLERGHTLSQKRAAVGRVLGFRPEFIGFYELGRRRLMIVHRERLALFYARIALEQTLRFGGRFVLRATSKVFQTLRRGEHTG